MLRLAILLTALLGPFSALAGGIREFPVGAAGILQLGIDDGWRETRPPSDSGATVSMESTVPGRMHLLLTPLPLQNSGGDIRSIVQRTADRIGPDSVEKTLRLEPLRGVEASGYYFKATDPAPKPGEFRFMYQGAVAVGRSLVTFTVLFNRGAEKDAELALSAVRDLRLVARSGARASNTVEADGFGLPPLEQILWLSTPQVAQSRL